jgi:hypothetical protein
VLAPLGAAGHVALAAFYLVFATVPGSGEPPAHAVALLDHILKSNEAKLIAACGCVPARAPRDPDRHCARPARRPLVLPPIVAAPLVAIGVPVSDPMKVTGALMLFAVPAFAVLRATARRGRRPPRTPAVA